MASIRPTPHDPKQCHLATSAPLCPGTEPDRKRLGIFAWQLSRSRRLGHIRADRRGLLLCLERLHPRYRKGDLRDYKVMGKGHQLSRLVLEGWGEGLLPQILKTMGAESP